MVMYLCRYDYAPYCFEKRILPRVRPITPEVRKRIDEIAEKLYQEAEPQLRDLEECSRVTAKDLAITINSPDPVYRK